MPKPFAIYHEHPDWFRPLFAELERRDIPFVRLDPRAHCYDPAEKSSPYGLAFNRMSPSAYLRGGVQGMFFTVAFMAHLERLGVPVVNGRKGFEIEISKARQLTLLESLGLPSPRARVINHASKAVEVTEGLRFPVVVKANIGGSGAGIVKFASRESLATTANASQLDFGVDHTALVQESAPLRNGHIVRVETLDGNYLYAIKVFPAVGSFDLCPADACQTTSGVELVGSACAVDAPKTGLRVEAYQPPREIIEQVEAISRRAGLDIGGIEYLVDERDGKHYFYDINALSNFVADPESVLGFNPWPKFVDYLASRSSPGTTAETSRAISVDRAEHAALP